MIHIIHKKYHEKKRWLTILTSPLSLFLLFCILTPLTASTSFANNHQIVTDNPENIIRATLKKITTFSSHSKRMAITGLTSKKQAAQLRGFIEDQIIPNFDFDNMSHWITGRYAKNMSELDKIDFKRSLRETFLSSLAKHLGSFDAENTRIKFHRARYRGEAEAFVSATIYRPNNLAIRLDFRMRRANETWKIIDIKANGASAVLYYRRHFISQLRQYQNQYQNQYKPPSRQHY